LIFEHAEEVPGPVLGAITLLEQRGGPVARRWCRSLFRWLGLGAARGSIVRSHAEDLLQHLEGVGAVRLGGEDLLDRLVRRFAVADVELELRDAYPLRLGARHIELA